MVVVGAGISGVACAREVAAAGHAVVVLDRGRVVGGRMARWTRDGRAVDVGAAYFTVRSLGLLRRGRVVGDPGTGSSVGRHLQRRRLRGDHDERRPGALGCRAGPAVVGGRPCRRAWTCASSPRWRRSAWSRRRATRRRLRLADRRRAARGRRRARDARPAGGRPAQRRPGRGSRRARQRVALGGDGGGLLPPPHLARVRRHVRARARRCRWSSTTGADAGTAHPCWSCTPPTTRRASTSTTQRGSSSRRWRRCAGSSATSASRHGARPSAGDRPNLAAPGRRRSGSGLQPVALCGDGWSAASADRGGVDVRQGCGACPARATPIASPRAGNRSGRSPVGRRRQR